jgi:eukaryotic-like serine/threonine-protein kinase
MRHDEEFESRVLRFEQDRRIRGPCAIVDYLGVPSGLTDPERSRLLVELICIDMEYGWRDSRDSEPTMLEGYLEQLPELISLDHLPIELIGEEYRARCCWGDRPSHEAFLSRFHERREPIRAELSRVDDEINSELALPLPRSQSSMRPSLQAEEEEPDRAVRLRSPDDFLLRRLIGAGRMGKVYEALHKGTGRKVAVKYLRKSFLHHREVVRRFMDEARTIARLRHPNIVGTEGLGRTLGGSYFIVMDLVDGPNLAQIAGQRPIAVDEAIRWGMATCDALEHAHEQGVVHCDLKPANLQLDDSGRIRVTDFGLARWLTEETPWTAEVEGTAPFMAPEQAARCWGPIDHRTDVYGLGAVLFSLLTGRPPVVGRRLPDVLAEVVSATPIVSPDSIRPGLPKSVSDLCRKCLSKEREARFPGVREVRLALEEAHIEDS